MEKIYYSQVCNSYELKTWLAHAILECVNKDILVNSKGSEKNQYLEVEFKINGAEVKFSNFIEELGKQWEQMVKDEASDMVKERISKFYESINNTSSQIKRAMLRIAKENDIKISEEDRWE